MQDKSPDLDEIKAIIADIHKDDQRAGAVIDRMRALLRRQTSEVRKLDVAEMIGDVVALVRPDAMTRHVKFTVEMPTDLPPVLADRVQLQQVLLNLVLNAMDAIGDIRDRERMVAVRARVDDAGGVEIAVGDNGPGIAADKLAHIFEPFFTTKLSGLGMGLAISHSIIAAHGGRLWAENNNGEGATFRFTLKTSEEAAAS
ncbi:MAG: sensor histidine kinase [Methylacidiphilales bacterium]|nr:sensor histidine kinase [Candidatus Methylacidiphilales bacterium]